MHDGADGSGANFGFLKNMPIELIESEISVEMLEYGLAADKGGAGEHRGGSGVALTFKVIAPNSVVTARNRDRSRLAPWGYSAKCRERLPFASADKAGTAAPGPTCRSTRRWQCRSSSPICRRSSDAMFGRWIRPWGALGTSAAAVTRPQRHSGVGRCARHGAQLLSADARPDLETRARTRGSSRHRIRHHARHRLRQAVRPDDAEATARCREAAPRIAGDDGVNGEMSKGMGSEDFAFMLEKVPGCFMFLGRVKVRHFTPTAMISTT